MEDIKEQQIKDNIEAGFFKDPSQKVTNSTKFGLTKGDLRTYQEDLTPNDWDGYPKVTVSLGEDLEKFQNGIVRFDIQHDQYSAPRTYLIQVDGLMSIIYAVYAKTLNDLRRATIRQRTVRVWGIFRKMIEKLKN